MNWSWDPYKNEENKRKHGVSFEVAQYAFNDPLAVTTINPYPYEERFATIGMVRGRLILVIHTLDAKYPAAGEYGRIISARMPTRYERENYEERRF